MLAAIALAAAPRVASAQQLKAEIPFGFGAQGTMLTAGAYTVTKDNTSSVPKFQLRSVESGNSILLVNAIQGDPKKAWESSGVAVRQICRDGSYRRTLPCTLWRTVALPNLRFERYARLLLSASC